MKLQRRYYIYMYVACCFPFEMLLFVANISTNKEEEEELSRNIYHDMGEFNNSSQHCYRKCNGGGSTTESS